MRTYWKYLFYLGSFVLWLLVIFVGLELWTRWHYHAVETRNPFVLSRTQGEQWPIADEHSNTFSQWLRDEELRGHYLGAGKSPDPLPPISPRWEMQNRLGLFRSLDDWGRQVFANVYGLRILRVGHDGMATRMFPVQEFSDEAALGTIVPETEAAWLMHWLQRAPRDTSAVPQQSPITFVPPLNGETRAVPHDFQYCIVTEPIPDFSNTPVVAPLGETIHQRPPEDVSRRLNDAWILYRDPDMAALAHANDLWDVPFFVYQKHVRRKDHINVLGLAEDFYSNNHGFRDHDFPVAKGDGVFRILCVGASTTEEGPTNALTYPAILEATLNRHFDTVRFEVINCGISGMNSLKHRMRIADYLALDPDMIILYNGVNDICHDLFPIWVNNASSWQQRFRQSRFMNRYFNRFLLPDIAEMTTLIKQNKMADLRFLVEYAQTRGVDVAVASFAAPDVTSLSAAEHDYYEYCTRTEWGGRYVGFHSYLRALDAYNNALRELCEDVGLLYIPVAEQLRGGAELFGDICHLRNPGIEAKASIIADTLTRLYPRLPS